MKFEGIVPALLTPFDEADEVDYDALGRVVDRLIEQGIGGLFVCGSTGEWWALTLDERMKIVDKVVATAAGRTKIMVHVGAPATRFAVKLAQHAKAAGVDAVSALPPMAVPLQHPEHIWAYFKAVGASTDLPLYLYHLPQVYGDLITVEHFLEALDTIPTLAGAKFSSYRIDDLIHLRLQAPPGRLNIVSGCGEQLLSAIACGAEGSICTWYNFLPRLGNKIIERVRGNQVEEARRLEDILVGFGKACISKSIGNLKWLMGVRGIECGRPREPVPSPTEAEREALLPKLEALGVFDWCV